MPRKLHTAIVLHTVAAAAGPYIAAVAAEAKAHSFDNSADQEAEVEEVTWTVAAVAVAAVEVVVWGKRSSYSPEKRTDHAVVEAEVAQRASDYTLAGFGCRQVDWEGENKALA